MPSTPDAVSHWHHSVENMNTSAMEFYNSIEKALSAKKVPVDRSRVFWNEGGVFSAQREYLRLGYGRLIFDICAFPFGRDYYFSWWLTKKKPSFSAFFGCFGLIFLPILWIGPVIEWGFLKGTMAAILLIALAGFFLASTVRDGASDAAEIIISLPYVGPVFERLFSPTTYYSMDTRIMFQETINRVVQEEVELVLSGKGIRALTPEQMKPQSGNPLA